MIRPKQPSLGEPDYSKAFYCDPPSHDFLVWLVQAEMVRRYHNAPRPLKVKLGLIDGQLGRVQFGPWSLMSHTVYPCGVPRSWSDKMVAHVLRPAIEMMGAVEEDTALAPFNLTELNGWTEYDYHIGALVDAVKEGHKLPQFKATEWADEEVERFLLDMDSPPIVITLREAEHQPHRNSRLEEWSTFAAWAGRIAPVVILRDTARAGEDFDDYQTWPLASMNAYIRMALYQKALVNMMVSNGPIGWCQFSDAPYLSFKQIIPGDWTGGTAAGWRDECHLEIGEQWPWSSPQQRLTWKDDTFSNLKAEFDRFMSNLKVAA